jgi:hypothetical protein
MNLTDDIKSLGNEACSSQQSVETFQRLLSSSTRLAFKFPCSFLSTTTFYFAFLYQPTLPVHLIMTVPPPNPDFCAKISPLCTIEGTLYGYYPNLGANAFFAAFFGVCFVYQLVCGIRYKTWTYMVS